MRFECNPSTHCMLTYLFCPLSKPVNPEAKQAQRPKLVWAMPCKQGERDFVTNPEAKVMPCGCKSRTIFLIAQAD